MSKARKATFATQLATIRADIGEGPGAKPQPRPTSLAVKSIRLAPEVFQMRAETGAEDWRGAGHVAELVRAIGAKDARTPYLDAVLVFQAGRRWYCVDGFARLAAYRVAGIEVPVPVEVLEGSLEDAVAEATRRNVKVYRMMRPEDRREAAFRLVKLGQMTVKAVALTAEVSPSTVDRMRKLLKDLNEARDADDPFDGSHREAVAEERGADGGAVFDREGAKAAAAAKLADAIRKATGKPGSHDPAVYGLALERGEGDRYVRRVMEAYRAEDDAVAGAENTSLPCCTGREPSTSLTCSGGQGTRVVIHTDGSATPNPGPAGWAYSRRVYDGATFISQDDVIGTEAHATNNQMELTAAINAIVAAREKHPGLPIEIVTDSRYVTDSASDYMPKWRANDWRKKGGKPPENLGLWQRMAELLDAAPVKWTWVRGHNGDARNVHVDGLANAAATRAGQRLATPA